MTAIILLGVLGIWILAATGFLVTASMMSSQISRLEEEQSGKLGAKKRSISPQRADRRIPTQPRPSSIN